MNTPEKIQKLKNYLKEIGLDQKSLAKMFATSQPTISAMINGKKPFGKKVASLWEEKLGINAAWLLTGVGDMLQIKKNDVTLPPEGTQMEFDFNKWIELENKKTDVAAKNADSMQALVGNNTTLTQTNETLVSMLKEALRDGKDVDKKIDAITAQMEGFLRPSGKKPAKGAQ